MPALNSVLSAAIVSHWHWCQGVRDTERAHGKHTTPTHSNRDKEINLNLFFFFWLCFGGRYKRRGIDEDGNVANYVETEQILSFGDYQMAFTIVRGSVPVYWSQPGYKYRPPPKLDRGIFNAEFIQFFFLVFYSIRLICIFQMKKNRKLHSKSTSMPNWNYINRFVSSIWWSRVEKRKSFSMHTEITWWNTITINWFMWHSISTTIGKFTSNANYL